jgi:hypothetical protein
MNTEIKIERFETRDNTANIRVTRGDTSVTMHSIQPYKEAERVVSRFNSEMEWTFIAGLGLGYVADTFLKKSEGNLIIYDPCPDILDIAKSLPSNKSLLQLDRVHFINRTEDIVPFLESHNVRELNYYLHRPYAVLFPDEFSGMEGILTAYLSKRQINKNTLKRFRMIWLRNLIKNFPFHFTAPGIAHLKHPFHGKPGLIVGAGPSLAKNIDAIRRYSDRMVIIATDTALPMLAGNGISPDFTVSADPQDKNALFLLYSGRTDTTLVIDAAGSFLTFAKYLPAQTLLYDSFFPIYRELSGYWGAKGDLMSGGSVSTNAFDFARFLGCSPIILAGQDLAYSEKKTHFRGNVLEDYFFYKIDKFHTYESYHARTLILSDQISIDGYSGGKVVTDRKFLTFLEWFKREIAVTNVPVINATEGGAFIPGARHLPLKETADEFLREPIDKSSAINFTPSDPAPYIEYLRSVISACDSLIPAAERAYAASNQAMALFRQGKDISPQFRAMNEFDRAVLTALKEGNAVSRFIELVMQDSIERIMESSTGEDKLSVDLIEGWQNLYGDARAALKKVRYVLAKSERISLS